MRFKPAAYSVALYVKGIKEEKPPPPSKPKFRNEKEGKLKSKRVLLAFIIICTVSIFGALLPMTGCTPTPPETIHLKFAHLVPGTNWWYSEVSAPWLDRIEQASNGRLIIDRYPGETLLKSSDLYSGVKEGIADMSVVLTSWLPGVFPLCSTMELPGTYVNSCQVSIRAKWETYKATAPWDELADVKVLRVASSPPNHFFTTNKQIRTLEDLKGMEISTPGSYAEGLSALGVVPVDVPVNDWYISIQKGVVEGLYSNSEVLQSFKLGEVLNYMTCTPFLYSMTFVYIMNLDVWNSLPKDIQKAFEDDAEFTIAEEAQIEFDWQVKGLKYAQQIKPDWGLYQLPEEEVARWRALVMPITEKEIAKFEAQGLPARKVWDELQRQAEKFNAMWPSEMEEFLQP